MRARILFGIMFSAVLGVRAAFPQAVAESAMVHAHSAATTAKAGSILGNALNKATNNIAGQIQTIPKSTTVNAKIQHLRPQKAQPASAATEPGSSSGGSMIVSIQGVRRNCGAASTGASNQGAGSPAGDASKSANCRTP